MDDIKCINIPKGKAPWDKCEHGVHHPYVCDICDMPRIIAAAVKAERERCITIIRDACHYAGKTAQREVTVAGHHRRHREGREVMTQAEWEQTIAAAWTLLESCGDGPQAGTTYGNHCNEIAQRLRKTRSIVVNSRSQERRIKEQTQPSGLDPRTIEVCAKVAASYPTTDGDAIADAIRALTPAETGRPEEYPEVLYCRIAQKSGWIYLWHDEPGLRGDDYFKHARYRFDSIVESKETP